MAKIDNPGNPLVTMYRCNTTLGYGPLGYSPEEAIEITTELLQEDGQGGKIVGDPEPVELTVGRILAAQNRFEGFGI